MFVHKIVRENKECEAFVEDTKEVDGHLNAHCISTPYISSTDSFEFSLGRDTIELVGDQNVKSLCFFTFLFCLEFISFFECKKTEYEIQHRGFFSFVKCYTKKQMMQF